jgi:hypothetical protein
MQVQIQIEKYSFVLLRMADFKANLKPKQGRQNQQKFEFSFHCLRIAAAKAIYTILSNYPNIQNGEYPEIFTNGSGQPVEYRFVGTDNFYYFGQLRGAHRSRSKV